jgi:hypothetical protein
MKTMNDWKHTGLRSAYGKKVDRAMHEANNAKRALWEAKQLVRGGLRQGWSDSGMRD